MENEIRALAEELAEISLELHRTAALTDTAVRRIKSKLQLGPPYAPEWDAFTGELFVQCMNSKNALMYHRLTDREYKAWEKLLTLTKALERWSKCEKPD